jgi:hypothetical protein
MGDFNFRVGESPGDLPRLFDSWGKNIFNFFSESRASNTRFSTQKNRRLWILSVNNLEILNVKFGSLTKGEFTYLNRMISNVVEYALLSEGLNCNILGF